MFYRGVFPPPIPCSSHLTLLTWEVKVIRSAQKMCKNLVTPCKIAKLSPVSSDANILELSFQWAWELVLWCHSGHPVAASAVSEEKRSRTRKLYQQSSSRLHLQSENKSGDVLRRSWPSDLQTGNCQIVSLDISRHCNGTSTLHTPIFWAKWGTYTRVTSQEFRSLSQLTIAMAEDKIS